MVGRAWRALFLLLTALLLGGCLVSTVNHLWATRSQFLKFDEHCRYEASGPGRGPALRLLHPKLTRQDILSLAHGRQPSQIIHLKDGETWIFRWQRRPPQHGKSISLELDFYGDLLVRLRVDKRFADRMGDARIEMMVRQFVGPATELDLFSKRVICRVPALENLRFPALTLTDMHELFGLENLIRELPLKKEEPSHIYRYQLDGATGEKAAMSFGASLSPNHQVAVVSSKLGSFSLAFDFSGQ